MVQNTQIRAYAFFNVRPLDFNRHSFAVAQNRAVHLGDGRAADRRARRTPRRARGGWHNRQEKQRKKQKNIIFQ